MGESCGVFVRKGTKGRGGCKTDRTKRIVINSITQTIPMNPLGRESCSAEASTIPGFHLHCVISESMTNLFVRSVILLCRLCPSEYSIIKRAGISAVGSGRIIYVEIKERKFSQKII